jgi:hypothetical protein
VESAWAIAKISGTLSWLEVFYCFFHFWNPA